MPVYDADGNEIPVYDSEGNEIVEVEGNRGLRDAKKAAEERARIAEERAASGDAAVRRLAALDAGLDPADKATAFFLKHYDGDTTAEAMKSAAIDAGIVPDIEETAASSVSGQAQMAAAAAGGEQVALGSTTVGPSFLMSSATGERIQVPAEQAEVWQAFEKAAADGDMQQAAEILRSAGLSDPSGIVPGSYEYDPGAGAPATTPITGRPL